MNVVAGEPPVAAVNVPGLCRGITDPFALPYSAQEARLPLTVDTALSLFVRSV